MAPHFFQLGVDVFDGYPALLPMIDGRSLVERIATFEQAQQFEPSGGYAALVAGHYDFGDLRRYYLGSGEGLFGQERRAWVLGCTCGEAGCWPLEVQIDVDGRDVVWSDFSQPHRPKRDYRDFGSFLFDRAQYEHAVDQGLREFELASR